MANDAPDKIKLDDITFEDFIGEGVETAEETISDVKEQEVKEVKEDSKEVLEDSTLDADIEDKKEEIVEAPKETEVKPKKEVEETVEDTVTAETSENDDSLISEISTKFGYKLEGEYDDTSDGLIDMTKEIANKIAEDQLDKLFESFPDVKQHLDYAMAGGDSREFINSTNTLKDVEGLKVTEENVAMQRALLGEYFKIKGHDDDFINELLGDYGETNKLYDKSLKAKEALVKFYQSQNAETLKKQQDTQKEHEAKQKEFWNDIKETITTNREFSGITIPEKEKNKFFTYISKPIDDNGRTQRDADHVSASVDTKLAIDYLMYKGFKLDDIIKTKAKTKITRDLKSRIKSGSKIKSANKGLGTASSTSFDLDDLDLTL